MKLRSAIFALILTLGFVGTLACQAPSMNEDTVAEVGGITITVEDLLDHPGILQAVDAMVMDSVILLECRSRGITLDEVKYKESIDGFIQQYGGKAGAEQFLEENNATWPDMFQYQRMQVLTAQLVENMAGEPTEDELVAFYNANLDRLRRTIVSKTGIEESEVTFADAREDVLTEVRNQKQGEIWQTLRPSLKEKYTIRNYITGEGLEQKKDDEGELAGILDLE